jgi:hypothetical protein
MKRCSRCLRWCPRSEFASNAARPDGLQNCCRECQRRYLRQHYEANRAYYLAKAHRANVRRYAEVRALLRSLKNLPCADCGVQYPAWVMDFDHIRGDKRFDVGTGVRRSLAVLLEEIAKCEVVCANCHRERTHRRAGRDTAPGSPGGVA